MKFLCLVYYQEKKLNALSQSEIETLVRESVAYEAALRRSGHLLLAHALQPAWSATTVRVRNTRLSTSDNTYTQTREQLGGFVLIDADGLHDALHIAAKIPLGRLGNIEVRPIRKLNPESRNPRSRLSNSASAGRLLSNRPTL